MILLYSALVSALGTLWALVVERLFPGWTFDPHSAGIGCIIMGIVFFIREGMLGGRADW